MDQDRPIDWALWRFGVLGPLVSARLEHGDLRAYLRAAAARVHVTPDGLSVKLSMRTIEGWLYAWRRGGLRALERQARADRGRSHIPEPIGEKLALLKRENPRRSIQRLIRILERSGDVEKGRLSKSSVQRLLRSLDLSRRASLSQATERRSFRHSEPGELWMGDVLHGPRVLAEGRLRKCFVIAFIDSATRFVPAAEVRLSEGAADHEYALKQAFLKHGLPRALYLDNGAAQRSRSLRLILAELGVRLIHTQAYDPQAKGAIERWNRTFRDEIEGELPVEPLSIDELRSRIWSWLAVEYNSRVHSTTGRSPREDWLRDTSILRSVPPQIDLDEVFLHRERRRVRRDGTVRFLGGYLEVRSALVGTEVELRFDPFAPEKLPHVFVDGKFVCDTSRCDPEANAYTRRHRRGRPAADSTIRSGIDALRLIQDEQLERNTPPAPKDPFEKDEHDDDDL